MKARPILFSGPMVRAILDGRKTQTRRILKPQPDGSIVPQCFTPHGFMNGKGNPLLCRFGRKGDRLWVRETFRLYDSRIECACYDDCRCAKYNGKPVYRADADDGESKWRPSIHMPRKYSRLTLEITDIRVERLNDISEGDAKAEGAFFTDYGRECFHRGYGDADSCPAPDEHHQQRRGWSCVETTSTNECLGSPKMAFANLWNKINGQDSWERNDWVWALTFNVINKNIDEVLRERD